MNDIKLDIDDYESIDNKKCYYCDVELTENNISIWNGLIDGKKSVNQCVMCSEINDRELSSCIIENDKFIPQKTREEIKKEIEKEGLTIKILKANEEKSIYDADKRECN